MKCVYLRETPGHEPGDPSRPRTWRIGEENEHPDCWRLCLPDGLGRIIADPADEECRRAVAEWKQRHKRKKP